MRAFDFVVIALIVLLGVWCLVLQVRSPAQTREQRAAAGTAAPAAGALEDRLERVEKLAKALREEYTARNDESDALSVDRERIREMWEKIQESREKGAAEDSTGLSKAEIERLISEGVEKQLAKRRDAAPERAKELADIASARQGEMLDEWVGETVTALGLQTQDEGILKEIIQERNRRLAEELLRDPDTPPEAKFMKVFTGELFKKVNEDMYDSLKRYYKDETLEAFRKHYRQSPPPLVIRSPEDESVTVIHAAPGKVEVKKTAPGPPKEEEEAPPQGH